MSQLAMKDLLEAGVHFGHQTKRWNPKMKNFIYGERNQIYIIDLQQTVKLFDQAYQFVKNTAANGESVLFVGTKRQAASIIQEEARRCEMFFVSHRWLGGMLTNFQTIRKSIDKLKKLEGRHSDLVFRDAKARLIRFIKNWAKTDGSRIGDKIILNNYLTHSDIAGVIATSRQSVNVLFNELRDSGLLFYNRQRIELNDPIVWN